MESLWWPRVLFLLLFTIRLFVLRVFVFIFVRLGATRY
jgi:hypothetical protein